MCFYFETVIDFKFRTFIIFSYQDIHLFLDALPIESVISMSPTTVGLQYSREASRGQVVLLPAPTTALGK